MCIYNKSHPSQSRCCRFTGWLVLCAVTLSPCTSVELMSLSLQLVITCSMRQYNILQSAVSSLASFEGHRTLWSPHVPLGILDICSCALQPSSIQNYCPCHHTFRHPFMCLMAPFHSKVFYHVSTLSVTMIYAC